MFKRLKNCISHFFKPKQKKDKAHFEYSIGLTQPKTKAPNMIEVACDNEQKVPITLKPTTPAGKPAKLDGKPTWSVTSGDGTLEIADDGLSAFVVSPDNPGETMYLVEADADLGSGIQTTSDAIKLTVSGAMATSLGAVAGAPVPK